MGFEERLKDRQSVFKKGVDAEESKNKREQDQVQIRKQNREEALLKKRNVDGVELEDAAIADIQTENGVEIGMATLPSVNEIPSLAATLHCDDPQSALTATRAFRRLLSVEECPPIQEAIEAGIVPRCVQFLQEVTQEELQFEAAWVLTNIASGSAEETAVVVENGALPVFVELLQSPNDDVREQAAWALGNIAGDSPNLRDQVLQAGGLAPVIQLIQTSPKITMTRNATWVLSNLCRGKPQPPLEWVLPALDTLGCVLKQADPELLADSCWALSYFSDGPSERIGALIQADVCQRLVELMQHPSPEVQTPALRAAGNVATGNDEQTQHILQCGALQALMPLLAHAKKNIRKEACWMISNITAGNCEQIQSVIDAGLIPPVIQMLLAADFDIKKEAVWVISNATMGGSPEQIEKLVECGCVAALVEMLDKSDVRTVCVALEGIENILKLGQKKQEEQGLQDNPLVSLLEQADGVSKIEALQGDENEEVYFKAVQLLERFIALDEDAEGADFEGALSFGAEAPAGGFNFDHGTDVLC